MSGSFTISITGSNNESNLIMDSISGSIVNNLDNTSISMSNQSIINSYKVAQNDSLKDIPRYACQRIYIPSFYCVADCVFDLKTQRSSVHTIFEPSYNGVTSIIDIHNINGVNYRYIQYGNFWQKVGLSDASANVGESFYNLYQEGHGLLSTTQLANLNIPFNYNPKISSVNTGFTFGLSGEKPIQEDAYLIDLAINQTDISYITKVLYSKTTGFPIRRYINKPLTGDIPDSLQSWGWPTRSWESAAAEIVQEIISLYGYINEAGTTNVTLSNNKKVRLFTHDFELTAVSNNHRIPVIYLDPSGGSITSPGIPTIIYYSEINQKIFNSSYDVDNISELEFYGTLTSLNNTDIKKIEIKLDLSYTSLTADKEYLIGSKSVKQSYYT